MASWNELSKRLEGAAGADKRLHIESAYSSGSLPRWLAEPMAACAANSGGRVPVTVVNVKNVDVDGALVVLSLVDFERLLAARVTQRARLQPPGQGRK